MAPSMELPPPPLHPELPPEVRIPGEEEIFFRTDDGLQIQAMAHLPAGAGRVAVLCHPHPLYGGAPPNPILRVVAKRPPEPRPRPPPRAPSPPGWPRLHYPGGGKSGGGDRG